MKAMVSFLAVALLAVPATAQQTDASASIFGYLAEVQTGFLFTLDGRALEVKRQGITLRAVHRSDVSERRTRTGDVELARSAAGYRAYFLEFLYADATIEAVQTSVDFYRGTEVVFTTSVKDREYRMAVSSDRRQDLKAFAISLENIPLPILDTIDRIDIREPDRRGKSKETFVR